MNNKEILVVITYLPIAAQGGELEFAVAGWRKHFKENYRIVIVGENLPDFPFMGDDITCIQSKRVPARQGQYRQHLDYVSCLKKVRAMFPDSDGFIHVADDCYAVNDFNLSDVKVLKCMHGMIDYDPLSPNDWRRDAMKTQRLLKGMGYPYRNFTTHIPIWYDWDKIEALWDKYDMENESYVIEDLYFNIYFPIAGAVELDEDSDPYKCGVYTTRPNPERLLSAFQNKIWITNNPDGWQKPLIALLEMHYGINH